MGRRFCFSLILIAVASVPLLSAPVPAKKNAKPAVISAGTEVWIRDIEESIPLMARYAILHNQQTHKMAIIRKYITDWKTLPKKEWDACDKWLKKSLHFERVKGKNLVRISFQDGNADEQAAIINVVVDYYLKAIGERRESLTKNLKTIKNGLENARRNLRITETRLAKADKDMKDHEEYIRNLPKLVEHAKAH